MCGGKLFHTKGILTYADRRQQRDFKGFENTLKREKQLSVNKDFKKRKKKEKDSLKSESRIMTPDTSGVTTQTHKRMPGCLAPSPIMAERSQRELQKDGKPLGTKAELGDRRTGILPPSPTPTAGTCLLLPAPLMSLGIVLLLQRAGVLLGAPTSSPGKSPPGFPPTPWN